jgi:phosphoribosylpyrophosphate synthetase
MANLKEKAQALLISAAAIDINNGTKQSIYVVPTGKSCVITDIVVRNLSGAAASNAISFGFNAGASDVIANATYASFTGSTVYTKINSMAGATTGTSSQIFGVIANTPDTAATATIDVFGYIF